MNDTTTEDDKQPPNSIPAPPKRGRGTIDVRITPPPAGLPPVTRDDPCRAGMHRPAYLVDGGVACGYCGTPM